jgi:hypothetical protein
MKPVLLLFFAVLTFAQAQIRPQAPVAPVTPATPVTMPVRVIPPANPAVNPVTVIKPETQPTEPPDKPEPELKKQSGVKGIRPCACGKGRGGGEAGGAVPRGVSSAPQPNQPAAKPQNPQKGAPGTYRPGRELPKDPRTKQPTPDTDVPHTQLGTRTSEKSGSYTQAREWGKDSNGKPVPKRDIDFTDHKRPKDHTNPHQHDRSPNGSGGTYNRGKAKPVEGINAPKKGK